MKHPKSQATPETLMTPIAVVGMGALFPGSKDTLAFWRDIMDGQDRLTEVPRSHWLREDYFAEKPGTQDKVYTTKGGFLPEVDFAPMEFGMPPNALPATDTAQLLALVVAKHALEEATRGKWESVDKSRMSVLLGVASATELVAQMTGRLQKPVWQHAMRQAGLGDAEIARLTEEIDKQYVPWQESTFPGLLGNVVAGRITNRFDMGGSNAVVDAACAGSLAALSMAVNDLALGHSDLVLTGGVDALNDIFMYMCFAQTGALSLSGDCRPFSDKSDGTMLGEGIGMIALRRLDDAERDGDAIYAVIRGLGSSSDGRAKSIYAPSAQGQTLALERAYERAGYGPETVGLVEAHGTSTQAGDAAEFEALKSVFGKTSAEKGSIALGSVKAQIGHTKAAAGSAGLIKAVLALHHKVLPPTIKVDAPNPKMGIEDSPFYLNTTLRPWVHGAEKPHPRRASVSALGFGGTNFHVALEEYVGPSDRPAHMRTLGSELVVLSADTPAALVALCKETAAASEAEGAFLHVAKKAQLAFDASKPARLAIVATNAADLREKLGFAATTIEKSGSAPFSSPKGIHYGVGAAAKASEIAVLFPGQGSQYVNMGADLATHFDRVRDVWDGVASHVRDGSSTLADRVFPAPGFGEDARIAAEKALTATDWAQPAICATSLSMFRLFELTGLRPSMVGGHSLGEVTAAVAAGIFDEKTGLGVARKRGELMAEASRTPGAMTAVAEERGLVEAAIAGIDVVLANHNAPKQIVLSGTVEAIEKAEKALAAKGFIAKRLTVATAFHSPIVAGAVAPFRAFLDGVEVGNAKIPYYANATAAVYPSEAPAVRTQLADAVAKPVRFVEQIEAMYAAGARTFVEIGPDAVLTKLVERCLEGRSFSAVALDQRGKNGIASLQTALGRLAVAGLPIAFARFWEGESIGLDPATTAKPKFTVKLNGANYGKPYPPKNPVARPPVRVAPAAPAIEKAPVTIPAPAHANGHATNGSANGHAKVASVAPKAAPAAMSASSPTQTQRIAAPAPARVSVAAPSPSAGLVSSSPARPVEAAPLSRFTPPRSEVSMSSHVPPKSPVDPSSFVESLSRLQAPAIAAQMEFQRLMAESHMAFLRAVETSYAQIGVIAGAPAPVQQAPQMAPYVQPAQIAAPVYAQPAPAPVYAQPAPAPVYAKPAPAPVYAQPAPAPVYAQPAPVKVAAPAPVSPAPAPQAKAAPVSANLTPVLLAVVAEKTGYPAEMIDVNMDMEADLGIDSIKRVEILSAMKAKVADLPQVATAKMAATRTLAQIIELFTAAGGAAPQASAPAPQVSAPAPQAPAPAAKVAPAGAKLADLTPVLLAVVAEKTGYPAEMIDVNMDMEADLGIDSIKRVEILSAMKQRVQNLPQVPTAKMAATRTLQQIIALFEGAQAPAEPHAAPLSRAATAAPPPAVNEISADPVLRIAVRPVLAPAAGFAMPGLLGPGVFAVTPDGTALQKVIVERLRVRGVNAAALGVAEIPADAAGVIFLGGLREVVNEEAMAVNREAFGAARVVAAHMREHGGIFVTVQDTGGDFALTGTAGGRAWLAGIAALAKTAGDEWPKASTKAIDLERANRQHGDLADAIVGELFAGGPELEVGLRADGTRITLASVPVPLPSAKRPLPEGAVFVVTGGARGVTASSLVTLAKFARPRVLILGRTPLEDEPAIFHGITEEAALKRTALQEANRIGEVVTPKVIGAKVDKILANREVLGTLASLEAAGAKVRYAALDVRDENALSALLADVRAAWGPIHGIVHGAGVLADAFIDKKTDAQFDRVFDTKVLGLRALLEVTQTDPLQWICLFSSVAARAGNAGQSDYAMANEILNKVAAVEARRREGRCRVSSIGWGPWDGGMVTPVLSAHFKERGVALLGVEAGAQAFVRELSAAPSDDVEVVIGGGDAGLQGSQVRPVRVEVLVNAETHPQLASHRIQGKPVLPMVLALEWFARLARAVTPGKGAVELRNARVVRGIPLDRFDGEGNRFTIATAATQNPGEVALELRDENGNLRYAATLAESNGPPTKAAPIGVALGASPFPQDEIYSAKNLFHGRDFQVIRSIAGLSNEGAKAELKGTAECNWPAEAWQTDVAAMDGGLQLAILCGLASVGQTLPLRIGQVAFADGPIGGNVRCDLSVRSQTPECVVCDIALSGEHGPIADLVDVEMYAIPSGSAS